MLQKEAQQQVDAVPPADKARSAWEYLFHQHNGKKNAKTLIKTIGRQSIPERPLAADKLQADGKYSLTEIPPQCNVADSSVNAH